MFLPVFAGICGGIVGGAGLIISMLYILLGMNTQDIHINGALFISIVVATAIAGYINIKIFLNVSPTGALREDDKKLLGDSNGN